MGALLRLALLLTAAFGCVTAQLPQQLSNVLSGLGSMVIDTFSDTIGGELGYATCVPYEIPAQFESYQDFCRHLSQMEDEEIDSIFKEGTGPQSPYDAFPLKGCVLGCIIGKNSYERGALWGSGSWSGKCIRNNNDLKNLLTPIPSLGGAMTVMDTFEWSEMLPVTERYPGSISVDWSWWDAYNTLASSGRMSRVWTLSYDDVVIPEPSPDDGPLGELMAAYPKLVKGSRDEVRMIEPGLVFGQLFRRPNSYLNPLPVPVDSGIRFAMIQVCQGDRYAVNGNLRDL